MKYAATLVLSAAMVGVYLAFSSGFFIPGDVLGLLGFSASNLAGIFSYSFLHISLQHLLGNLFLLIPLGLVVEPILSKRSFFAIYFVSGILGAAVFAALTPNVLLVGASAAIAGLVIPACLVSLRRTVFNILVFTLLAVGVIWGVNQGMLYVQKSAEVQATVLAQNISTLEQEKNKTAAEIIVVEEKYQKGEIQQQAYEELTQNLSHQLGVIENKSQVLSEELNKTATFVATVEGGKRRERESQTSLLVHLLGSLSGLAYLCAFRRDIIANSGMQFFSFIRWLERHKVVKRRRRR